jgi:4-hydroxybutyryl-CoA dehydratase/vinylacetyl-CoA-Delta-isomerase
MGAGACALGKSQPSGSYFADELTAHSNKVLVATLPYEVKRQAQDICGGIVETGCMHGGGSPDGAKLVVRFKTPFEEYVGYAQKIMDIDEKISEPTPVENRS